MSVLKTIQHELKAMAFIALYFLFCFGFIMLLKKLFLEEYHIQFRGLSTVIIGALIVSKAVIILDNTSAGTRFEHHWVYLNVFYKSLVYTLVVFLLGIAEQIFDVYREVHSFKAALVKVYDTRNQYQFIAGILCIGISFIIYNVFSEINQHLGEGKLKQLFFSKRSSATA